MFLALRIHYRVQEFAFRRLRLHAPVDAEARLVYSEIERRLYFMIQARTDMNELPGQIVVVIGGTSGIVFKRLAKRVQPVPSWCSLHARRNASKVSPEQRLRETLPIGRVVSPADVAALATGVMRNGAITGATLDIDGGRQLVPS
jgi:hypothetical protein